MNFKVNIKVCRVCMKWEEGRSLNKDMDLQSKFVFTTRLSLTPGDSMPALICTRCELRLKVAHDFIQLAHKSDKNLKTFLTKVSNEFNEVTKINCTTNSSTIQEDEISTILEDTLKESSSQKTDEKVSPSKQDLMKHHKAVDKKLNLSPVPAALKTDEESIHVKESKNANKEELNNIGKEEDDDEEEIVFYEEAHFLEDSEFEDVEQKTASAPAEIDNQAEDASQSTKKNDPNQRFYGYLQEYNSMLSEQIDHGSDSVATHYIYDNSEEDGEDDESAAPVEVLNIYEENNTDMLQEHIDDNNDAISLNEDSQIFEEKDDEPIDDENTESSRAESEQCIEVRVDEPIVSKVQKVAKSQTKNIRSTTRSKKASTKSSSILARFFCVKCNRDFSTKTNLTRHMLTHEGVKPYQCMECGKSFSQNGSLKLHMLTHTGEKPYVCQVCNRGFTQFKSLVFHMRRHTGEKPFPCEHCGMFFRQRDGLRTHILNHHMIRQVDGGKETHTCTICKQLLATKLALREHMKKHMNSHKPMNFQLSDTITEENPLVELITDDDLVNEKSFISEELALNIEDVSSSAQIIDPSTANTIKVGRAKKFQCRKCYKCFAIKKNLLRHLTTHDVSASELFQCKICQVAFDTNYALRVHLVREHKETSINLNECEYCNITFSNANELSDHNNTVHESLDQKCTECPDLHFKTQKQLMDHVMEHENLLHEIDDD